MGIAALILWIITAAGGFYLLATWIGKGGLKQQQPQVSRFPSALILGHFALAAVGLIVWIVYVAVDEDSLTWVAFIILILVAALGFTMFARWLPGYRGRASAAPGGESAQTPAEQHFPIAAVAGHGALAVVTLVLVLLAALEIGS